MIGQSEILSRSQIKFITLFCAGAHRRCCAFYQPPQKNVAINYAEPNRNVLHRWRFSKKFHYVQVLCYKFQQSSSIGCTCLIPKFWKLACRGFKVQDVGQHKSTVVAVERMITEFFCRIVRIWEKIQTRFCFCRNRWVVTCNAKWTKWTRIWEIEIGGFCCAGIVCVCVRERERERERESSGTLHELNKNHKTTSVVRCFSQHMIDHLPRLSALFHSPKPRNLTTPETWGFHLCSISLRLILFATQVLFSVAVT